MRENMIAEFKMAVTRCDEVLASPRPPLSHMFE
jgi:hypothetical protein